MAEIILRCWSTVDGVRGWSDVDIAPALLNLTRALDTEFYYQVTTLDGRRHSAIRSQHEVFTMVLGCDKVLPSGTVIETVGYLVALSQSQNEVIEFIYNGINEGECEVVLGQMGANKVKNGDFVWDMMNLTVTVNRGGSIGR